MSTIQATRVLVLEDDAMVRQLVSKHLRRNGYEVTEAENAEQALERMPTGNCDLVLADVHLPGDSGVEFARRLREMNCDQPVVFLTGDPDEGMAREAMDEGAAGYLLKPFEFFELDSVMKQALRGFQQMGMAQAQPASAPVREKDLGMPGRDVTVHAEQQAQLAKWREAVQAPERVVLRSTTPRARRSQVGWKAAVSVVAMITLGWVAGAAIKPAPDASLADAPVAAPQTPSTVYVPYMIQTQTVVQSKGN